MHPLHDAKRGLHTARRDARQLPSARMLVPWGMSTHPTTGCARFVRLRLASVRRTHAVAPGVPTAQGTTMRRRAGTRLPRAIGATEHTSCPRCAQTRDIRIGETHSAAPVRWLVPGSPAGPHSAPIRRRHRSRRRVAWIGTRFF